MPPLQLPPVELWRGKIAWRELDVARSFAAQKTNRNPGCSLVVHGDGVHWPTDQFATKEGLISRENRGVRHSVEPSESGVAFMNDARRVELHLKQKDCRIWGKLRCMLQNVLERQIIAPRDCNAALERLSLP